MAAPWEAKVQAAGDRFRALEQAGVIKQYGGAYSPADTLADTRFVVTEHERGTQVIPWREVDGYLAGAEKAGA